MQLEAIYDHGQLKFVQPVTLKHEYLRLIVNVPDEEIISGSKPNSLSSEVVERARVMRERLDAIRNAPLPPDDELPELSGRQRQRIAAFELREDR
jgi:predicted DNA-binding antitoxin AbrB/MazE fold protein